MRDTIYYVKNIKCLNAMKNIFRFDTAPGISTGRCCKIGRALEIPMQLSYSISGFVDK